MAKAKVTPELASTIREIRIMNNIKSKDLAEHIGKSPASISKLEKGEIQGIEVSELLKIFNFIKGDTKEDNLDELLSELLNSLEFQYSNKEIEDQIWFQNFDEVYRKIPVSKALLSDFNFQFAENQVELEDLVNRVNNNEDLEEKIIKDTKYEYNSWYNYGDKNLGHSFIKIKLDLNEINDLFSGKIDTTNFSTLYALRYYFEKMLYENAEKNIDEETKIILYQKARNYLFDFKFYTVREKNRRISVIDADSNICDILNEHDNINRNLVSELLSAFNAFSEYNVKYTNEKLSKFIKNLKWDSSFMLALVGIEFSVLENISTEKKRDLLHSVKDLIGSVDNNEITLYE